MGLFTILTFAAVMGLGVVFFWVASGLNMKHTDLKGALLQGLIVTPFFAVGGVAAFLLFSHFVGVPDVQHIGVSGAIDVLAMVGIAGAVGGIFLGLAGFFMCIFFD